MTSPHFSSKLFSFYFCSLHAHLPQKALPAPYDVLQQWLIAAAGLKPRCMALHTGSEPLSCSPPGCFQLLWSKVAAAASKLRVRILESCVCAWLEWEAFLCVLLNTALSGWELHKLPSLGKVPYGKWAVVKISTIFKLLLDVHIQNEAGMVQLMWNIKCLFLRGRVSVAVLKNFFWCMCSGAGGREDIFKRYCWRFFQKRPPAYLCVRAGVIENFVSLALPVSAY